MNPIITVLEFGSITRPIGGYGLMMVLGVIVGVALIVRALQRAGDDVGAGIAALGFVAMGSLAGAWLVYVAVETYRTGSPMSAVRGGGLVFFGAPFGGMAALMAVRRGLHLRVGRFLDLSVPALPAAHAMGRIGCLLGGCCFGAPYEGPLSVLYTHPLAPGAHPAFPRHPTPLYEAGGLLLIAFIFSLLPRRGVGRGERFATYFAAYAALRFIVERFRGDEVRGLYLGELFSTSDVISLVVFALALSYLIAARRDGGEPASRAA